MAVCAASFGMSVSRILRGEKRGLFSGSHREDSERHLAVEDLPRLCSSSWNANNLGRLVARCRAHKGQYHKGRNQCCPHRGCGGAEAPPSLVNKGTHNPSLGFQVIDFAQALTQCPAGCC
jgi:hypothetical protein